MGNDPVKRKKIFDAMFFRVLLVEDNPGDARLVSEMLVGTENNRFEMVHTRKTDEALHMLKGGLFDVILLDLSLTETRGMDTLGRFAPEVLDVPIVVLTGIDDEETGIMAVHEGAQDYLVKGQVDSNLLTRSLRYAIERHKMRVTLRSLSLIDTLTGLFNRRGFLALAEQYLRLSYRNENGFLMFFADMDNLKHINDSSGHQEGDNSLVKVAHILKKTFRDSDILGRIGGDEFTILALNAIPDSIDIIKKRLQVNLDEYNAKKSSEYELSLSVGVSIFNPQIKTSVDELIARADKSMYDHKRSKRSAGEQARDGK